jgi:hypothetical protein
MTGWTVTAVGVGAPGADLFGGDRALGLLDPGEAAGTHQGGFGEVDVQHHLTLLAARLLVLAGGQVEGGLVAGQVAGGDGAAHVQRLGRAQEQLSVGVGGEGAVEVDRVGQVEVALDVHGPGGGDLAQVDIEAAPLGRSLAFGLECLGVEPGLGLLDQPFQLGGTDLVRHRRDMGVHERGRRG